MKLTELHPCTACRKPLGISFYAIAVEHHLVAADVVRNRAALDVMFPTAPDVAAAFWDPDDATIPMTRARLLLCIECFSQGSLASAWEAEDRPMTREAMAAVEIAENRERSRREAEERRNRGR